MKSVLQARHKGEQSISTKAPSCLLAGIKCVLSSLCTLPNRLHHSPQEGNKIFSGGADNAGRMFDVTTGQATQVAQHDAPIKVVKWIDAPQASILATGSWDKTIKVRELDPNARMRPDVV